MKKKTRKPLHWSCLVVTDGEGYVAGYLGDLIDEGSEYLNYFDDMENGAFTEATDIYLSAPGEEPDAETPRGPVDWTGLRKALEDLLSMDPDTVECDLGNIRRLLECDKQHS